MMMVMMVVMIMMIGIAQVLVQLGSVHVACDYCDRVSY